MAASQTLQGKVALVTGASGGIGEVIARELATKKVTVVLLARREDELKRVLADISKVSPKSTYYVTDITNEKNVQDVVAKAFKKYGPLHILVNNAGIAKGNPIVAKEAEALDGMRYHYPAMSAADVEDVWRTNFLGPYIMTQAFCSFAARNSGEGYTIVDILSTAGRTMYPANKAYGAFKAAHRYASNDIAGDVREFGVEVRRIYPGNTKTNIIGKDHAYGRDQFKDILAGIPDNEKMESRDVAAVVLDVLNERYTKNKGPYDVAIIPQKGKGKRSDLTQDGLDVYDGLRR